MTQYCKCKVPIPQKQISHEIGISLSKLLACKKCLKLIKLLKVRKTWKRKPQTQIKKSDKIYNRKKAKHKLKKLKEE